jgi:hypothetical protein
MAIRPKVMPPPVSIAQKATTTNIIPNTFMVVVPRVCKSNYTEKSQIVKENPNGISPFKSLKKIADPPSLFKLTSGLSLVV